jgi:hypothetical protein
MLPVKAAEAPARNGVAVASRQPATPTPPATVRNGSVRVT